MQNIATQELIKNKSMLGTITVFAQASRTILWRQRKENHILRFAEPFISVCCSWRGLHEVEQKHWFLLIVFRFLLLFCSFVSYAWWNFIG